jgi:molecular chaperone HtpG
VSDEEREQQKDRFATLLPWLTTVLEDKVKEVRLSNRLTSSPAVVVGDTFDASPALISMYKAMGQHIPEAKRILELNPAHPLVEGLRTAHTERPDDEHLAQTAELLYGMALMADGSAVDDPARFVQLMADHLARALA